MGATVISKTGGTEWLVENMPWDGDLSVGQDLVVDFLRHASGDTPPTGTFFVEGVNGGSGGSGTGGSTGTQTQAPGGSSGTQTQAPGGSGSQTQAPANTATNPPGNPITPGSSTSGGSKMKYNYGDALGMSILFYDAQRSGKLPANNPIAWRGDSAVDDNDGGHDLSGGWYDAGDHVKFNLPMAYSTWVLEWGFLQFKDAYAAAGQTDMMCDMIKWPLDYFLKCWVPDQNKLYVQVGDGGADHSYWGRPENMHMNRPAYKVTRSCKGSDVAAATASALAAGSMVFKDICGDNAYATKLLTAAKSLYTFAKGNRGLYSQCMNAAAAFYGSTSDKDDLAVAACLLNKATGEASYLTDAKSFHEAGTRWALSWDDTMVAADLMLYEITKDNSYKNDVTGFVSSYMPGGSVQQTPCGLAYRDQWGANRYAANAAFIATMAAADGINPDQYKTFAMSQINYILGDNKYHMSYEVGFGSKYPEHAHHRGSSCSKDRNSCSIGDGGPNPNLLKGAMVGGPDNGDSYQDRRDDYVKNEVACDYNAGFQGSLAGLLQFSQNSDLPA